MQRSIRSSKRSVTERFSSDFKPPQVEITRKLIRYSTKLFFPDADNPLKKKLTPVYTPAPKPSKLLLKYISEKSPAQLPGLAKPLKSFHRQTLSLNHLLKRKPARMLRDPNRLYPFS